CWCGPQSIACIASNQSGEESWYASDVRVIGLDDGAMATIYTPSDQLGWISASPSGRGISFVEAACSDRMLVAGTLMVGNAGGFSAVDTRAIDVTYVAWQGESDLSFAGLRGFETVLAHFDVSTGALREAWASSTR